MEQICCGNCCRSQRLVRSRSLSRAPFTAPPALVARYLRASRVQQATEQSERVQPINGAVCQVRTVGFFCLMHFVCATQPPKLVPVLEFLKNASWLYGCGYEKSFSTDCLLICAVMLLCFAVWWRVFVCCTDADVTAPLEAFESVSGDYDGKVLHDCQIARLLYTVSLQ